MPTKTSTGAYALWSPLHKSYVSVLPPQFDTTYRKSCTWAEAYYCFYREGRAHDVWQVRYTPQPFLYFASHEEIAEMSNLVFGVYDAHSLGFEWHFLSVRPSFVLQRESGPYFQADDGPFLA